MAKSEIILSLKEARKSDVTFYVPREKRGDLESWVELKMSRFKWQDLGSPETVTLTIEAGDQLNAEEVAYRDAGTGQYVSEEYADANPDTTVGEAL